MSCISFLSPEQRATLGQVSCELSPAEVLAAHPMPPVTEGTLHRLRLMALDADLMVRSAAASKPYAPAELLTRLAADPEAAVRSSVARNELAPEPVLRRLSDDPEPTVRGWAAANRYCPADVLDRLADDPDQTVRQVVRWARSW